MRIRPVRSTLALAAVTLASAGTPLRGRTQSVAVDARFGMAPSVGGYSREPGPTVGVGLTVGGTPSLGVRADASWAGLDIWSSNAQFDTYTLGVDGRLAASRGFIPLLVGATLGAGVTHFRNTGVDWVRPTVAGGIRLFADLFRGFGPFLDASVVATRLGRGGKLNRDDRGVGGTFVQVPVTAGLRLRF